MLAALARELPDGDGWLYEPKWDGFRALIFRDGDEVYVQSRDCKPLNRYFPELAEPVLRHFPPKCVLDGELVIAGKDGLDFDSLLLRIHPAASRIKLLAKERPASFVAFDLLSLNGEDLLSTPLEQRRTALEAALRDSKPPIYLTPATRDRQVAADWFSRFEGAGLDGVIAKRLDGLYLPDKRAMTKVKHQRTADCVVAGFRWHKNGPGTLVGSLLLGLYDDEGTLHHLGITSAFTAAKRKDLVALLEPYRKDAFAEHPWREWGGHPESPPDAEAQVAPAAAQRMPGASSRWNRGKDLSWEPLRPELVVEVAYDHLQGDRFRHATVFVRFRPDKPPKECTYSQLETVAPAELADLFAR